jgi:septum formation protein
MAKLPIYLASKSPRRRFLLKQFGIKFKIITPKISEKIRGNNPKLLAIKLAKLKVHSIEGRVKRGIIIGVDTIVVIDGNILGKPRNKKDARYMIQLLSGKEHKVISGLYILRKPHNRVIKTSELTKVKFRKLSRYEIENYVGSREPYDKAGAYGIQEKAGLFVERINGCYFNVVGLPIVKLLKCIRRL